MTHNLQDAIQIFPTNYPNNILLGTQRYNLQFSVKNNLTTKEKYQFKFSGVGLNYEIPDFLSQSIEIDGNQTINFSIGLIPTINGQAKIVIDTIYNKEVKFEEKTSKLRPKIDEMIISEAISNSFYRTKSFNFELPMTLDASIKNYSKINATLDLESLNNNADSIESSIILDDNQKNQKKIEISKKVFSSDKEFAFSILSDLPDSSQKEQLLNDFILCYAHSDFNNAIKKLDLIKKIQLKDEILRKIIGAIGTDKFKEAVTLSFQINDSILRDDILLWLIEINFKNNIDDSLSLLGNITNGINRAGLFYEILKYLFQNDKDKCNSIIDAYIDSITHLGNINLLKYSIILAGALNNPDYANNLIMLLPEHNETIDAALHKYLWHETNEIKIRHDQIPVSSVYYTFNTAAKPDIAMEMVNKLGGNISENLLSNDFSSFIGIICPFGFNFPIFPSIERAYSEIKAAKQKSFYYMLIPTKVKTEEDFVFAQTLLNQWFVSNESQFNTKVYLFNLDFIPYLAKPTIIMGSDLGENSVIESVTNRVFGDSVKFIIDNGLFKDGMVNHLLKRILPQNKFKIINLVMTYDFLNDYTLLKRFMEDFVK